MLLQRLNSRQRAAALIATVATLVGGSGLGYYLLGEVISEKEEALLQGHEAIVEIQERARDYLDSMRRKQALEEAIKANDQMIQTAIDYLAKRVDIKGAEGDEGTFSKVLRYEAKTTERAVYLGESGKKKKRDKASDFVELSQPAEFSFVKFVDLVRFLEQIESPDRLMYVSKLEMTKKYMDPEFVQGKLTIATFIYKPQPKEEEEAAEEE
jgi:hypothetical protein